MYKRNLLGESYASKGKIYIFAITLVFNWCLLQYFQFSLDFLSALVHVDAVESLAVSCKRFCDLL